MPPRSGYAVPTMTMFMCFPLGEMIVYSPGKDSTANEREYKFHIRVLSFHFVSLRGEVFFEADFPEGSSRTHAPCTESTLRCSMHVYDGLMQTGR